MATQDSDKSDAASAGTQPAPAATSPSPADDKKALQEVGVSSSLPGVNTIVEVFAGDHKDIMLLAYFTTIIKLFGGSSKGDSTVCLTSEEVVDWLAYCVIVCIYIFRHFVLSHTGKLLQRIARTALFSLFALCLHDQPISCSLPRMKDFLVVVGNGTSAAEYVPGEGLGTLHYTQGAIMLTLALITTELFRRDVTATSNSKKTTTAPAKEEKEMQSMTPDV
eukprot:scpid83794/ scgid21398/ 